MRAMVLRDGQVQIEEVERPSQGLMQVLARVRACGVCGSDLHFARFAEELVATSRANGSAAWGGIDLERGVVMGHEFVAEVVEVGHGVTDWPPGSRVVSVPVLAGADGPAGAHSIGYSSRVPGAYGEYVLMSAPLLLPVPDHVPDRVAATTEPCAVGLHAVREARVHAGERVLILGVGPIGLMTLLWLKHDGVEHVTVSDPAAPRRELAARLGADLVLDPHAGDLAGRVGGDAGGAPQVVFDCVGVPGTLQEAMNLVEPHGRVIVVGVCMPLDQIRPMTGILKQLTIQFVLAYSAAEFAEALGGIASGAVDPSPLITRRVSLDELPAAFRALADPRECKVVLEFP